MTAAPPIESVHVKEVRRLQKQCAAAAITAMRQVGRRIPQNQECREAYEQWCGATELFYKYADDPSPEMFEQARAYLEGTAAEFHEVLQRDGAFNPPTPTPPI